MPHLPLSRPEEIGLDARRLHTAYQLMESWTSGEDAPIPGGAIVIGRNGGMVPPRAFGRMGPEPGAPPIRPDAIFLLASITKPVVYFGALMLVERGLLNLSDPVTRYIPDFAAHHKDGTLVQHLFTHTSGLPDMLENNVELRKEHAPLERFIDGAIRGTVPLFRAGTGYSYQSMGTLVVAELVQRLSGQPIREFLRREIFDPLELRDTALGSQGLDPQRIVRVRLPGFLEPPYGWNSTYWRELGVPWGGMFSTLSDFAVICQLMLNLGEYHGTRLLSPSTVMMATTNRLDDYPDLPESVRRTQPWGLGWKMNQPGTSGSLCDLLGRQVFGHTGATGTLAWMDPHSRAFCLIFTSAGGSVDPQRTSLSNALAAAVV
jgi:CubicO group peptidase (beta-lactamase class C family)